MPLNTPNLAGDVSGGVYATSVDKLKGNTVASTSPASGQVLTWDGTQWAPATPSTGGGGGANGLTYYLNQNTAADSPVTGIPGTPKQLGRVGETGQTEVTTGTLTQNTWTRVAGFVSESAPQDPATILIPAGLWDLNVWALGTANQNAPSSIRALIYIYNGTTTTLIATSSATVIGTSSAQYSLSALVSQTTIAATDRIYIELQALATGSGHTVTAQFGDGTPSHVHTSLPLVGGTGLWKNVAGALQSPASLLVDADVDAAAAIAQSKIAGLTTALANVPVPGTYIEFLEHFMSTTLTGNMSLAFTGGSNTIVNSGFGVVAMSTGTAATANHQARLNQGTNNAIIGSQSARVIFRFAQSGATWFDATVTGALRCGWGDSTTGESGNGIYFRSRDGQGIDFVTRASNIETLTSTGVSFTPNTFRNLEILINSAGTEIVAKIDGATVATHTTNIPTARLIFFAHINRTAAVGTAVIANIDFVYSRITPNTPFF